MTSDEEVAYQFGRMVAETPVKPYFEYRDFVASARGNLVAENEEARYFAAILKTLQLAEGADAVAFLIDEFEEISLQNRLTRRDAHDYLVTLRRLLNLTNVENFWVFLAMTPDSLRRSEEMQPSLWERLTGEGEYQFRIPPLSTHEAVGLVRYRLATARADGSETPNGLFPFPENLGEVLSPVVLRSPRRLIKFGFYAISGGEDAEVPFTGDYLRQVEATAYPSLAEKR